MQSLCSGNFNGVSHVRRHPAQAHFDVGSERKPEGVLGRAVMHVTLDVLCADVFACEEAVEAVVPVDQQSQPICPFVPVWASKVEGASAFSSCPGLGWVVH